MIITIEVGEMEVKFKYYLSGNGWATYIVEVNGQKLEFAASYEEVGYKWDNIADTVSESNCFFE